MLKIEDVTKEFLTQHNHINCIWLRDDWLSMRGMETDREKLAIYDKIADIKQEMKAEGYIFVGEGYGLR